MTQKKNYLVTPFIWDEYFFWTRSAKTYIYDSHQIFSFTVVSVFDSPATRSCSSQPGSIRPRCCALFSTWTDRKNKKTSLKYYIILIHESGSAAALLSNLTECTWRTSNRENNLKQLFLLIGSVKCEALRNCSMWELCAVFCRQNSAFSDPWFMLTTRMWQLLGLLIFIVICLWRTTYFLLCVGMFVLHTVTDVLKM